MSTAMHRLQISLPPEQMRFLAERARREGRSIAQIIRDMVRREAEAHPDPAAADALWALAGIAEDHKPLINGVPVSEHPELYLANPAVTTLKDSASD